MCMYINYFSHIKHIRRALALCKSILFPQMVKCISAAVYNLFCLWEDASQSVPRLSGTLPGNRDHHLALYSRQECLINTLRPASSWLSLLKFFCRKHRGPSHEGPSNFLNRVPSGALFKHYQYAQSVKFRGGSRG